MIYTFIDRACPDLPTAACCRAMKVSTSGFYAWRNRPCSDRDLDDAYLTNTIVDIHRMSRRSYGSPRVHAELRLGLSTPCSRKRVERLMRQAGIAGIHRRRRGGCTRRDDDLEPAEDLVQRAFDPVEPDRLWVMDVTEHPTGTGKVYLAVVLDAFSRRVVGWSIADHIRSQLVVDAVQMATWRRQPTPGQTVAHSDHGAQYTSWAFGLSADQLAAIQTGKDRIPGLTWHHHQDGVTLQLVDRQIHAQTGHSGGRAVTGGR